MPKPRNSWPRLECLCSRGESGCEPRWPACPFCRGHCLPEAFMGWFVKHSWAPLCLLGGGGLCRGALHSWNSLKTLPDMPSATHHVNGKEGLEGSQPGGPCASHVGEAVLIAVWRKVMAMDEDSLGFYKATDSGGGKKKHWPWSLYHNWALSQGSPASPLSPCRPSSTPNQVWLPWMPLSLIPQLLKFLNGSSWPGLKALWDQVVIDQQATVSII